MLVLLSGKKRGISRGTSILCGYYRIRKERGVCMAVLQADGGPSCEDDDFHCFFLDSNRLISAPNPGIKSGVPTARFKETLAVFITRYNRSRRQKKLTRVGFEPTPEDCGLNTAP